MLAPLQQLEQRVAGHACGRIHRAGLPCVAGDEVAAARNGGQHTFADQPGIAGDDIVVAAANRRRQLADGRHALAGQPFAGFEALFQLVMKAVRAHGGSSSC
ncbi:hypothetical protein D3C71_1635760 [compost metagenome]